MIDALEEMYPQIPLCMHQDHGNEEATCATALQHGFTSVMMDGSLKADAKTAADYDYNVDITRRVVDMAHWIGASVEGELGVLGSLEHGGGEQEDGHGVEGEGQPRPVAHRSGPGGRFRPRHRGRRAGDRDGHLARRLQVLPQAGRRHPGHAGGRGDPSPAAQHPSGDARLVLGAAGAAGIFNSFGGEMPQTWGVPVEEIVRGIRHGVRKVNIDTDCRLAMTAAFRKVATQTRREFDPRKFLKPAMDAMRDLCRERFEQFGTAGNALENQGDPAGRDGETLSLGRARSAIGEVAVAAE